MDLGTWRAAKLIAEYDPEDDVVRVDASAVAAIRAECGDAEADRFVAAAIAHELQHRDDPQSSEAQAHRAAFEATRIAPSTYEAILRRRRISA